MESDKSERGTAAARRPTHVLRLLGAFELRTRDGTVIKLPTRKSALLLSYLATPTGQSHTRDKLAGMFWGDSQDEQARGSLRQALTALRLALGHAAVSAERDAIMLRPGYIELDTEQLAAAAGQGASTGTTPVGDLYAGEFLEGVAPFGEAFAEWLLFERTRQRNLAEAFYERAIGRLRGRDRLAEAVPLAQRLIALDPLREQSHRILINLYAVQGERAKALGQYQALRNVLATELHIEPSAQTLELARRITLGQSSDLPPDAPAHASGRTDVDHPSAIPLMSGNAIAVLPFGNASGDDEQDYFADGISEDIIAALCKVADLIVIARNSSFSFRGKALALDDVSRRLGARYIVDGSVRKSGQHVRITAHLVDAMNGRQLWSERFDRDLVDIFAVQDEVARKISTALAVKLTRREPHDFVSSKTSSVEAYDCFLRGRELHHRYSRAAAAQARILLQKAIELDPGFAPAHAYLGLVHSLEHVNRWTNDPSAVLASMRSHSEAAIRLDPEYAHGFWALAALALFDRKFDEAERLARHALSLNPNFAEGYSYYAYMLHYGGKFDDALAQLETVLILDPAYPDMVLHLQAQSHFQLGDYEAALALLKRRLVRRPDTDISRVLMAACYGHLGRYDEAAAAWRDVQRVNPDYSLEHRHAHLPYKDPRHLEHFMAGLRKAGLTG